MPRRTQALHFPEGTEMRNFEKMDDVSYAFVGSATEKNHRRSRTMSKS